MVYLTLKLNKPFANEEIEVKKGEENKTAKPVDSFVPYVGSDNPPARRFYCRFTSFPCKTRIFITEFI